MTRISYSGYRFPSAIIQQAIWLYLRFTLSLCDVEDLLAERGIAVSYESIRRWINLSLLKSPSGHGIGLPKKAMADDFGLSNSAVLPCEPVCAHGF